MTEQKNEHVVFIHYSGSSKAIPARHCILLFRNHDTAMFQDGEQIYISNYWIKTIQFKDTEVVTRLFPASSVLEIEIMQKKQKEEKRE